jgi:hypothetical protein
MNTQHGLRNRLEHMPVSLFTTVMGLTGLTLATQKAEQLWQFETLFSTPLLMITIFETVKFFV